MYLLKNQFLSKGTTNSTDISSELFLSLLSFHSKLSLSSSHFLSVLSALSSLFALSVVGLSVGFSVEAQNGVAWACRRGVG